MTWSKSRIEATWSVGAKSVKNERDLPPAIIACWSFKQITCASFTVLIRVNVLCDGKTGCTLGNPSEVFAKAFPRSTHGLADVNRGAVTAGDAVDKTRRQIGEGRPVDDGVFWALQISII